MGINKKILEIMKEAEAIAKDMAVGSGNYSYKGISERAVLNAVKPLLIEKGVIVYPCEMEVEEHEIVYKSGKYDKNRFMTQLKIGWKFVDVESGESITAFSPGNGADGGDKGSGKAFTYAYKAVLQKTFMLFSGEDTDNTHSKDLNKKVEKNYKKQVEKDKKNNRHISTKMLKDLMEEKNISKSKILETYKKETGKDVSEVKFITQKIKKEYFERLSKL